jgi:hypothetical protein
MFVMSGEKNKELFITRNFGSREETSLSGVAQAVVDQVVRLHHARVESNGGRGGGVREDITLLIREFGRPPQPRTEKREEKTLTSSSIRLFFTLRTSVISIS